MKPCKSVIDMVANSWMFFPSSLKCIAVFFSLDPLHNGQVTMCVKLAAHFCAVFVPSSACSKM